MNEGTPIIIKKKKGHGGHGHHGGSWKVAYADFVTAMMAFFMVMWIMGLSDSTRSTVAGYFNDPMGFMKQMPRSHNALGVNQGPPSYQKATPKPDAQAELEKKDKAKLKRVKKHLEDLLSQQGAMYNNKLDMKALASQVEVTLTPEGLQIEFMDRVGAVFFESGSAVVRPEAKGLVMKVGKVLGMSQRHLRIQGHTDAQPFGDGSYDNWDLSNDRANAMRHLLMKGGVMDRQLLRVENYADRDLKRKDDPLHYSNRRVTILLPFEASDLKAIGPRQQLKLEKQAEFDRTMLTPPDPGIRPPSLSDAAKARAVKASNEAIENAPKTAEPASKQKAKPASVPEGGTQEYSGLTHY